MRYQIDLKGISPGILMHNLQQYFDPGVPEHLKDLLDASKNGGAEAVHAYRAASIDCSLYLDRLQRVIIPLANFSACLQIGVKKSQKKNGEWKNVVPNLMVDNDIVLIDPEGNPITRDVVMSEEGEKIYWDIRPGRNPSNKVPITLARPIFADWTGSVTIDVLDDIAVSQDRLKRAVEAAGAKVGIGNWRPDSAKPGPFGRFKITGISALED